MSLILEALKKLEREKNVPERGFLVMAPVEWRASRRRLGLVLGIAAASGAAAAMAALWWFRGAVPAPPRASVGPTASVATAPSASTPSSTSEIPRASSQPTPPASDGLQAAPGPSQFSEGLRAIAEAPHSATVPAPTMAGIPRSTTAPTEAGNASASEDRAARAKTGPTAPPPVGRPAPVATASAPAATSSTSANEEPRPSPPPSATSERTSSDAIHLQAISERDGEPVAVINERLVREGDSFDGVRVVKIGADHVELEVRGRRRVVRF
jgi:hypothetical protein